MKGRDIHAPLGHPGRVAKKGTPRATRPATLAQVIAELGPAGAPFVDAATWKGPIRAGEIEHPPGFLWLLDRADLDLRVLRRNVQRADVVLVVVDPWTRVEIAPADRDDFWASVEPYLSGRVTREPGDHTDFRAGRFLDSGGRTMVALEQYC